MPEDEEIAELEALARTSAPAIRNAQEFREARQLADVDALTGLHNRRYFHETLERECARAHRYERGIALVILDIDDFKATNDRLGHLAGDAVLAAVAERLREAVRQSDVACRVGGDEFAVILPEAGARDAEQLYRRIQFAVGSGRVGARRARAPLGRDRRAPARRRLGVGLPAGRRGSLPGEGSWQGPGAAGGGTAGRLRPRAGLELGPASACNRLLLGRGGAQAWGPRRAAAPTSSRRLTRVRTSSRKRAQSDSSSSERKCPGGAGLGLLRRTSGARVHRDQSRSSPPRCGSCG